MQARFVTVVAAAFGAAAGCQTYHSGGGGGTPTDASFEGAPRHVVAAGDGIIGAGVDGKSTDGGIVIGGGRDGGVPGPEGGGTPDRPASGADTAFLEGGRGEIPASNMCDLARQNCPSRQSCYPASGGGRCEICGGVGTGGPCLEHTQCVCDHVCADVFGQGGSFCRPVCDPQVGCTAGERCVPLGGTSASYCAP